MRGFFFLPLLFLFMVRVRVRVTCDVFCFFMVQCRRFGFGEVIERTVRTGNYYSIYCLRALNQLVTWAIFAPLPWTDPGRLLLGLELSTIALSERPSTGTGTVSLTNRTVEAQPW